ncbi:hypothetical protein FMM05_08650 [Flavobacterium zepuense]|uniref:Uncharacterized protein n=1 Tax=Flavobacterium zepuense TaxID=2593302 RepID=A0A552V4G4_9FLAO|nr:DUF6339 family protein [Flavobacterium zepuense]TRW25363.1 hypothetical protein FMM05_08650 [Flavobacterium zepuense]
MDKQLIFKSKYLNKLKGEVQSGLLIDHYKSNLFIYDKTQTLMLPNIITAADLADQLDVNDDCKTAILLYEAFKNLEPIQASDERLWTYLTHVDLYSYMIRRWDAVYNSSSKDEAKYIFEHWFLQSSSQSSLLRHALAGLWWAVSLSVEENKGPEKYDLTKILFRQLDFPTRTLGTYKLGRHKEAVIGILEFIKENDDLFTTNFEDKTRYITKHLNIIGGVKPISYYKRDFFKAELKKITLSIQAL